MNNPVVSVCMPVYNGTPFLKRAFACLAKQTLKNFELIIVDDGSTDYSAAIAAELMAQYKIYGRVIQTSNHGAEQARDVACHSAQAELIAPFDCDDQWAPTYLEEMVAALQSHPEIGLVYCDFVEEVTATGYTALKSETTPWIDLLKANRSDNLDNLYTFQLGSFFEMLLRGQVLFPPCTVFRRTLFRAVDGYYAKALNDLQVSLDWYFGLRISRICSVAFLKKPLLRKHLHGKNVSHDPFQTFTCDIAVLQYLLKTWKLSQSEQQIAKRLLSAKFRDVAYVCWTHHHMHWWAFKYAVVSLAYQRNKGAAKTAILSLIPFSLIDMLRKLTGRTLAPRTANS